MEAVMARMSSGGRAVALVVVVLGALAVSLGFGAGAAPLLIVIAAVAGLISLVGQRRILAAAFGPRAPLWPAAIQAWWAPLAAVLGAMMLLFAVGTLFEAHNWGGRVFGTAIMLALGSTMLLGLMRRPLDRVTGNTMILLATIPAFAFFWVIVPAVVAIVIWIGVLSAGFGEEPAPASS